MLDLVPIGPTIAGWVSVIADWASIVGLADLGAAFYQLMRTKSAVAAANDAIRRTEAHLALNQVLVLLPQLQKLEDDLDAAVHGQSREAVLRHLGSWRSVSMEVYGLVREQEYVDAAAAEQLRESAVSAAAAKSQLVGTEKDVVTTTRTVRREIAGAASYAGVLSGQLKAYSGGAREHT